MSRSAVFRGRARGQAGGIEIGFAAELIDALRDLVHVARLFLGVLREFRLDAFAGNAGGGHRVHGVAQHANDLGREHRLQNLDGLLHVALIGEGHAAAGNIFAGALAQRLDVGEKRL